MIDRPRRNRVTPFGLFEATPAKGLFLGNRGDIHSADGGLSNRQWAVKAWICCALSRKSGGRIEFDRKGTYYPLFFADEATAFAAGHRPCVMCRYRDYQHFKHYWLSIRGLPEGTVVPVAEIDAELHEARVDSLRRKRVYAARLGDMPDGAMVTFVDEPEKARLVWHGRTYRWHQSGYGDPLDLDRGSEVTVLTPAPLVDVFRAGYVPVVHASALWH